MKKLLSHFIAHFVWVIIQEYGAHVLLIRKHHNTPTDRRTWVLFWECEDSFCQAGIYILFRNTLCQSYRYLYWACLQCTTWKKTSFISLEMFPTLSTLKTTAVSSGRWKERQTDRWLYRWSHVQFICSNASYLNQISWGQMLLKCPKHAFVTRSASSRLHE